MRDLTFYPTYRGYRTAVRERFEWSFLRHPFYNNLINYIINTRAPIFYTISDPSEHFAFSGAYHFETKRERYPNKFRENLFWIHDFTHLLFPYYHDVYNVSEYEFTNTFIYQERLASTETEVFAYYRIPELREKVFPDEKLYYDVIRERQCFGPAYQSRPWMDPLETGWNGHRKPNAVDFLTHRNALVNDDAYGEAELGDYPEILAFFRRWRTLTPKWCGQRYKSMVGKRLPTMHFERLNAGNYEARIENYSEVGNQDDYERITLFNLNRAFAMLGWEDGPTRWRHAPDALNQLEGAVFFKD